MKDVSRWHSPHVEQQVQLVRWGSYGTPVLLFPTAGGDAEEVERFGLVDSLSRLLAAGLVKVYSTDSIAGRAIVDHEGSAEHCSWLLNRFHEVVYHEIVPAIRVDCRSAKLEMIAAGASIGAFNAVSALCRHPDVFRAAVAMSGTFDLEPMLPPGRYTEDFYYASPMHFVPNLSDGPQLGCLRRRFALLAFGQGRWEDPSQSWRMADVLGSRAIPNRVDAWGPEWDHDWPTWRQMAPHYLGGL